MTVTEVNPNMSVRPKCPYCRDIFALQAAQPPRRPCSYEVIELLKSHLNFDTQTIL